MQDPPSVSIRPAISALFVLVRGGHIPWWVAFTGLHLALCAGLGAFAQVGAAMARQDWLVGVAAGIEYFGTIAAHVGMIYLGGGSGSRLVVGFGGLEGCWLMFARFCGCCWVVYCLVVRLIVVCWRGKGREISCGRGSFCMVSLILTMVTEEVVNNIDKDTVDTMRR